MIWVTQKVGQRDTIGTKRKSDTLWGIIVSGFIWLWDKLSSLLGEKRKLNRVKTLLSREIKTNQRELETLEKFVNEGLRDGKDSFEDQYDFPQPEISVSFEMKNYQGLAPFEVLSDEYAEKIEKYYHKLRKLEDAWNAFISGEPRGPDIKMDPPQPFPNL